MVKMTSKAPPPIWISPSKDLIGSPEKYVEYTDNINTKKPQSKIIKLGGFKKTINNIIIVLNMPYIGEIRYKTINKLFSIFIYLCIFLLLVFNWKGGLTEKILLFFILLFKGVSLGSLPISLLKDL